MHKLREFIDRISNVLSGHRQILKVANNGIKLKRIEKCNAKLKRQCRCGRQWVRDWSGICYRSSNKKICDIPLYGNDQAKWMRKDFNAKKVYQGDEVRNSRLIVAIDDDVINIH